MISKSNKLLRFLSAFLLFIAGSLSVFATDGTVSDDVDFKFKEQVDLGISNQLGFLMDFNVENEKNNKSDENSYVYIVGEDTFDTAFFSDATYVSDHLVLDGIAGQVSPLNVTKLKLIEISNSLSAKKLPLIYYGVANKKKAIPSPFFPFEGQNSLSATDSEKDLLRYYFDENLKEFGQIFKNWSAVKSDLPVNNTGFKDKLEKIIQNLEKFNLISNKCQVTIFFKIRSIKK